MDRSSVNYEQLPDPIRREQYETARQDIIELYSGLEGVEAIYETGTVADPGISDLDIKVLYDSDSPVETPTDEAYSEIVDVLVGKGNVIKAPVSAFKKFHYIGPKRNPTHLYGREIDFKQPTESDRRYRDAAYVLDYLPERLYQALRLERQETLPVMRTLQMLKSVGYSSVIMGELLDEFDGQSFADDVADLRGNWFDREQSNNFDRMHELIAEASETLAEAARLWFERSPPELIADERVTGGAISLLDELVYVSGEHFEYGSGEEFETVMTIPSWWMDHYRYYTSRDHFLGESLATGYVGPETDGDCLTPAYKSYLDIKLRICNEALSWSVEHDTGSALKFGYLLHRLGWDEDQKRTLRSSVEAASLD